MCPKVTEEYKQAVREKILQSAENLFARKGYHETSMDDIVKESGLSKGAIYGYFESKQDLFLALSDKRLAFLLDRIQSIFLPEDSAAKKLEKALEITFSNRVEVTREVCRVNMELWVEAPRITSLQQRLNSRYETAHKFVAEIIKEGVKKGEFRQGIDPHALASVLLAAIDGLSLHWATTGQDFDWQKIKNTLSEVLGEGIRAVS